MRVRFIPATIAGLSVLLILSSPALARVEEPVSTPVSAAGERGYEAAAGITSRAQALIIFDGRTDKRLAVMTGKFKPTPHIFLRTPFRLLGKEMDGEVKRTQYGYFWKFTYNSFSLDTQEDPVTGGIGFASPRYDYGTRISGHFITAAPVYAIEILSDEGIPKTRLEIGIGAGYLSLDGNAALGDQAGAPVIVKTELDYNGPALFLFTGAQHNWKNFLIGFQMGISATSSKPYSYSQSYVALDAGYRISF